MVKNNLRAVIPQLISHSLIPLWYDSYHCFLPCERPVAGVYNKSVEALV